MGVLFKGEKLIIRKVLKKALASISYKHICFNLAV